MAQSVLPDSWYTLSVAKDVDISKPGIYCWVIDGVESYIGKYSDKKRPTQHYGHIVARKLASKRYRKSNPNGFRRVHIALCCAVANKRLIELRILENVEPARLQERETELIRQKQPMLNGPAVAI